MMASRLRSWLGRHGAPAAAVPEPENLRQLRGYAEWCRACGVDRLYLVLTFDCDTDLDIDVARNLEADLGRRGIKSGYAVPGLQLQRGAETWRALADGGNEFLNHGGRPHAEFRDGRYWPVTFYDKMTDAEVVADIEAGHGIVCDVVGVPPVGFRAPHFGSFQRRENLDLIYRTIKGLGYAYGSTTLPALALERGPVIDMAGIVELPTMGSCRHPLTLLDSWTYLTDRANYALGDEYGELFVETIERMRAEGLPGLLTYYADPSHVYGQPPFERALDAVVRHGVPSLHGREAARRFRAL